MKRIVLLYWFCAIAPGLLIVVGYVLAPKRRDGSLTDENPAMRAAAVRSLPREGSEERLIGMLKDEDADLRLLVVEELGGRGRRGGERAEALIPLLKDEHAGIRREAAWSLSYIGPDAWPALKEALQDENPQLRSGAALALSDAYRRKVEHPWPTQESQVIVPILDKLLDDEDPEVRKNAEEARRRVGR